MAEYLRPDVYVERMNAGAEPIQSAGTATAGFIGITQRGEIGKAKFITSWTDFVSNFARGLETPFMRDSDLAYAVYGYFQNGGGRAFVVRTAGEGATKATASVGELSYTAKEEGTWGNNVEVFVEAGETAETFNVIVKIDAEEVERFEGVGNNIDSENYYAEVINGGSNFIEVGIGTLAVETARLIGGEDGIDDIQDTDYLGEKGVKALDVIEDVTIVAIPGQTSKAIQQGILDYCATRGDCFGIVDLPLGLGTVEAQANKQELGGNYGACYYPWGKVVDPIGRGQLRLVPPSGHIAGIYARTDQTRGVHKAPAGTEAQLRGFVELERQLSNGDVEILNSSGVNCLVAKPNYGTVVWGARLITPDKDRVYVSDMRLDIMVEESLYSGTQWTVFEPNDEVLWGNATAQVKSFLYGQWVDGALFGADPDQAYFVKCDAELNTQEIRDAGKVIIEVGYAKKKPAEFTIIRITQKATN